MSNTNSTRFNPTESKLLHEKVISSIFQALIEDRLSPGERLYEEIMSEELGVSRGTIRRALQELSQQGIVELIPRKGARMASWNIRGFENFYQVRQVLEGLAAKLAAINFEPDDISAICDLSNRVRISAQAGAIQNTIDWEIKYHYQIVKLSRNTTLINIYESMLLRIKLFLIAEKKLFPSDLGYERSLIWHETICEALKNNDSDLAKQLMEKHIQESASRFVSRICNSNSIHLHLIST